MKKNKQKLSLLMLCRLNLELDIRTFAKGCGVGENLIGKYEKWYCAPSLSNLYKIWKYLKASGLEVGLEELIVDFVHNISK